MINVLNEGRLNLDISNNTKNISREDNDKLFDLTYNGIEIVPLRDDVPTPWDALLEIDGNYAILTGDFGQQGTHDGSVICRLPINKFNNYYEIGISLDDENYDEVKAILDKYGWNIKR